jgi:hypothetical protein
VATRRAALVGGVLLAGLDFAQASTINVPGDYATVLAGVDEASPGDTVLVGPGTGRRLRRESSSCSDFRTPSRRAPFRGEG